MAYNQIPKTAAEMRKMSKHLKHAAEARRVYDYCVKTESSIKDPIAMDPKESNIIKIFRELKGVISIDEIKRECKIKNLKLSNQSWGNGTRGGGGANALCGGGGGGGAGAVGQDSQNVGGGGDYYDGGAGGAGSA